MAMRGHAKLVAMRDHVRGEAALKELGTKFREPLAAATGRVPRRWMVGNNINLTKRMMQSAAQTMDRRASKLSMGGAEHNLPSPRWHRRRGDTSSESSGNAEMATGQGT